MAHFRWLFKRAEWMFVALNHHLMPHQTVLFECHQCYNFFQGHTVCLNHFQFDPLFLGSILGDFGVKFGYLCLSKIGSLWIDFMSVVVFCGSFERSDELRCILILSSRNPETSWKEILPWDSVLDEKMEEVSCCNRGCGQKFNPQDNPPDSNRCTFHPGEPLILGGHKVWSCCNTKCGSTDVTELPNTPGQYLMVVCASSSVFNCIELHFLCQAVRNVFFGKKVLSYSFTSFSVMVEISLVWIPWKKGRFLVC